MTFFFPLLLVTWLLENSFQSYYNIINHLLNGWDSRWLISHNFCKIKGMAVLQKLWCFTSKFTMKTISIFLFSIWIWLHDNNISTDVFSLHLWEDMAVQVSMANAKPNGATLISNLLFLEFVSLFKKANVFRTAINNPLVKALSIFQSMLILVITAALFWSCHWKCFWQNKWWSPVLEFVKSLRSNLVFHQEKTTFSSFLSLFHVQCFPLGHTVFSLAFFILFLHEPHKTNNWWEVHKGTAFTCFRCWWPGVACYAGFFFLKTEKKFRDWTLLCLKVRVLQMCNGWYSCTYPCTAELDFKVSEVGIFRE